MVIDADGLYLVSIKPHMLENVASTVIFTPNVVEFNRLTRAFGIDDASNAETRLRALAKS